MLYASEGFHGVKYLLSHVFSLIYHSVTTHMQNTCYTHPFPTPDTHVEVRNAVLL
jgi:hypothetical protein